MYIIIPRVWFLQNNIGGNKTLCYFIIHKYYNNFHSLQAEFNFLIWGKNIAQCTVHNQINKYILLELSDFKISHTGDYMSLFVLMQVLSQFSLMNVLSKLDQNNSMRTGPTQLAVNNYRRRERKMSGGGCSLFVIRSSIRAFLRQVGPPVSCFAKHLGCSLNSARRKTLWRHVETNSTTERKSRCDSVAKTSPGLSAAISSTFWWITVKITATLDSFVTVTRPVTKQFALPA